MHHSKDCACSEMKPSRQFFRDVQTSVTFPIGKTSTWFFINKSQVWIKIDLICRMFLNAKMQKLFSILCSHTNDCRIYSSYEYTFYFAIILISPNFFEDFLYFQKLFFCKHGRKISCLFNIVFVWGKPQMMKI